MASNLRYYLNNLLENATLKNGTGGAAPARDEASPYVMEYAQNGDRYSPWVSGVTPTSPINVDYDLGSNKAARGAAFLGMAVRTIYDIASVDVYYLSSGAYPGGVWTFAASLPAMTSCPVDNFVRFGSVLTARYWRFTIASISQYQVGRAFLGAETDFGYSPEAPRGASWKPVRLGRTLQGDSGATVVFDRGRTVHTITQRYAALTDTEIATLRTLRDLGRSLLIYDIDDVARECIIPQDGGLVYELDWGAPNLWNATVTWQELA